MTPSIKPTSTTWTLRFKFARTTILLHVDPLQPLPSVRAELLKAVQQTFPSGSMHGTTIPESESDIMLARPVDDADLELGWEALEVDDLALGDEESVKGKGKAKKNKITDCPQGAGLRDGGVVAFKFRSQAGGEGEQVMEDSDEEEEKEDWESTGQTLVGEPVAEKWNVVVPTMEETYRDEEGEEHDLPVLKPRNAT